MSGIKETYVQMTTSQRDAMRRQCNESRDEAARQRYRANQLENANRDAQSRISTLTSRLNTEIHGLSNEMREIERKQNLAFRNAAERQRTAFQREMQQREENFKHDMNQRDNILRGEIKQQGEKIRQEVEQQGVEIRRELKEQRNELIQIVGNIERQINAKERNCRQLAEFWTSQAEAFLKEIENYRHELFKPTKLQSLRARLGQMQSAVDVQAHEAVISIASEVFNGAVTLRADVVEAELEWTSYFERLSADVAELYSAINDAKLLEYQIGEDKIQARIDYWSDGALVELAERITEIQQVLCAPNETTSKILLTLITEVYDMTQRLSEIKESAREALMLSACRADIANDVANALINMGWKLEDSTFVNCEEKEAIHAKIVDRTGNECVIIVEPHNNQGKLGNKLQLNFFSDDFDTSSTETYVSSVKQELRNSGVEMNLQCAEGYRNKPSDREDIRDINQARGQTTGSK